jgi:hypothetical protein
MAKSLIILIIFSTDAFARRECSLLLPPVKEGRGIIQLRYAPRSYPEVNLFVTFYSAFKVGAVVFVC